MENKEYSISIIIPVFKEESTIERCINESVDFFSNHPRIKNYEIIFAADYSGDRTIDIIKKEEVSHPQIKLIVNEKRLEKGGSIKIGMLQGRPSDLYLFYDTDLSTPLDEFNHLLPYIDNNDIVIGSRHMQGAEIEKSLHKTLISKTLNLVNFIALGLKIHDTQCGFKLFNRKALKLFKYLTIHSSAFDIELLYMARKGGLRIKEIPVKWSDSDVSNFNHFQVIGHFIRDLLKIRLNALKGYYSDYLQDPGE